MRDAGSQHSEGYHVAMERIELEMLRRDPRYRDLHHHNWDLFGSATDMHERREHIRNVIVCSLLRCSAILAHHILGTRDPDESLDAPLRRTEPVGRLLSAILYQTPICYVDGVSMIWFCYGRDGELVPGYQVHLEEIELMTDFADIADSIVSSDGTSQGNGSL